MRARLILVVAGAVGLAFAAFLYYLAMDVRGTLRFAVPLSDPNLPLFLGLLAVALFELGVVLLILIRFASRLPPALVAFMVAGFVGFAGVYALLFGIFSRDPLGVEVLAALAIVRMGTVFFIPVQRPKP